MAEFKLLRTIRAATGDELLKRHRPNTSEGGGEGRVTQIISHNCSDSSAETKTEI
jgi:hypothetical protein